MAKVKTKADEYKEIFIKLHRYQRKGADNLILLLTRFVRAKAEYNYTLGYFVNQSKIAVGKSYTCRFSGLVSDALIIELRVQGEE